MKPQSAALASIPGQVRLSLGKAFWFWSMFVGALLGLQHLSLGLGAVSALLIVLSVGLGHSVGLHRGMIHGSYSTSDRFRAVLLYFDALSGLGGPIAWARLHALRDYWQSRSDCPPYFAYQHSIGKDFVWNLHYRFDAVDNNAERLLPEGLLDDSLLRFYQRTWLLHLGLLTLVVFLLGGLEAVLVCVCLRVAVSMLGHWFVGYAAHRWGTQRFVIAGATESGTNHWLLGVLSFGEGFHNNHHAFPGSARMGFTSSEFDLSYQMLRCLAAVKLVTELRVWPDVVPHPSGVREVPALPLKLRLRP